MSRNLDVSVGNGGCISIILFVFLIWALLFGVTCNGAHHGVTCESKRGVVIE